MKLLLNLFLAVTLTTWISAEDYRETTSEKSPLFKELENSLVKLEGKSLKKFDDSTLSETKYIILYFSAHWCPPCRAFTPKLVDFYNQTKPNHPEFELVFVSSDRSEAAQKEYMIEASMPWTALKFSQIDRKKLIKSFAGNGIPCVVVLDREGKVLAHSYKDNQYMGPQLPIDEFKKLLK